MKLTKDKIYRNWRFNGSGPYNGICDLCHRKRNIIYEFIHPSTPYGKNYDGFRKADELLRLGSECVQKWLKGAKVTIT